MGVARPAPAIPMTAGNKRLRKWLAEVALIGGPKSVRELTDSWNRKSHHGTSAHALVNILGKSAKFRKAGLKTHHGLDIWSTYQAETWELA